MTTAVPHRNGYLELGLCPQKLLRSATPGAVAREVEQRERDAGNPEFRLRHLARVLPAVGIELASVYLALRERFPLVRPDDIDAAAKLDDNTLGVTYTYNELPVELRRRARTVDVAADAAYRDSARDPSATGCIALAALFGSAKSYAATVAEIEGHEVIRVLSGLPAQPPVETTLPTSVLVHEFGHLAEAALAEQGLGPVADAFAELSKVVFGGAAPCLNQWGRHLVNYPELPGSLPGPYSGGHRRRKANKAAAGPAVSQVLGRYAAVNRDELFAEAFTLSLVGRPEMRDRLSGFLACVSRHLS